MDGEIEGVGSRCKGGRQVCAEHSGKPGGAFAFIYLYRRNDKNWKSLIFIFLYEPALHDGQGEEGGGRTSSHRAVSAGQKLGNHRPGWRDTEKPCHVNIHTAGSAAL